MNRRVTLNGNEVSIRFYYGERDEKHPERSYTKEIELTHGPNAGKHRCRFVECRIEKSTEQGWKPIAVAESICGPEDRFEKREGRCRSLRRAINKLGLDSQTARRVRVYGLGDHHSIDRYNKRQGITSNQPEAVEV